MTTRELQADRIRRARAAHGQAGRGNPCPEALRCEAVAYSRALHVEGASVGDVALELGIPAITLARWAKKARGRFLPVVVETAPSSVGTALVVHGPRGLRIEGLDIASLAALIKGLA